MANGLEEECHPARGSLMSSRRNRARPSSRPSSPLSRDVIEMRLSPSSSSSRSRDNALRRPQSGSLGEGLFELRGKQIRIFYMFLPGRRAMLLDGEIKKRGDIPPKTLKRMRGYRDR